ncbi:MAG: HAMP domain-containing protein [Planctomycetes bacterium]|nr:HAMP domain-containing protein [Planctomycetota bacterium]
MNWLANLPIRRRLTLLILVTCSTVLLIACAALAVFEILDFRHAAVRDATVLADILAENTHAALSFDDANAARKVLRSLQAEPNVALARVFKANGDAFTDFADTGHSGSLPLTPAADGHRFSTDWLDVYRPITFQGARIGTIFLRIDLRGMYERLTVFAIMALVVLLGSMALALVLSSRLQRPISEPILALARTARAVAEQRDYTVRAPKLEAANELGMLTDAFNHMLAQIAKHADDLAATNAELEQFAYIASHDLKEPLRMVTQYMGIVERQLGPTLTPKHQRFIAYAVEGAMRMQTLINDLLAFTRTSHLQEHHQPVELNQVVTEVLTTFQDSIHQAKATVQTGPLPVVAGERTKLAIVFQNLIGNALKFQAQDRQPVIDISAERAGDDWNISITDNGIGIDRQHHEQIFAVFQRLHGRDEYPGNGMGLAICRKIIEQHHGALTVESEVGRGSRFVLRLPAVMRVSPPPADPETAITAIASASATATATADSVPPTRPGSLA